MTTPRALISLNPNSNFIKVIIGDKSGKDLICPVVVLPNRGSAAVRTGPRVSDLLTLKPVKPALRRTNYIMRWRLFRVFLPLRASIGVCRKGHLTFVVYTTQ
jgi:hypothetical protein